ncbi:MAG: nucleotidyl transferase AbiEii/AbiGii toxin family protein [Eubacteriales bacterium]|nr:nucleotidyl transferase AbiEii/AbiGii toxin family protein [Eubacteriales bacterium]
MDIDTTVKGIPVTIADMERTITEILDIEIDDYVSFRIKKVSEIMDEAEYPGIRFSMDALLDGAVTPLKIDISTGDEITPREISYSYQLMFEDRSISIMTYPIETVLAEKLETFISRSTTNTRMRDLYDIHLLLESQKIDYDTLAFALERTAKKRGSFKLLANAENVLKAVESSDNMKKMWDVYRKSYHYASEYTWEDVLYSVRKLSIKAKLEVLGED